MKFVETEDLKNGMRLARPIYNRKGVLLFERDSRLNSQTIDSVKNFGLLGVYILEPAEPLPPMSEEDLEFERFQTQTVYAILDEMEKIIAIQKQTRINNLVATVIKNYGHLGEKVNFYQNLRSKDDYVCRHALNTAILCAMIAHTMKVKVDEQIQAVTAALLHDIGKMLVPPEVMFSKDATEENDERIYQAQLRGIDILEETFADGAGLKRVCSQAIRAQHDFMAEGKLDPNVKLVQSARILLVANRYDEMTAMNLQGKHQSEVKALQEFRNYPELYDPKVVDALIQSINILFAGVSVELNTGQKGLVLAENPQDVLRPMLLTFGDNTMLDLSLKNNRDIEIVDIMKTLDNRYVLNDASLKTATLPPAMG